MLVDNTHKTRIGNFRPLREVLRCVRFVNVLHDDISVFRVILQLTDLAFLPAQLAQTERFFLRFGIGGRLDLGEGLIQENIVDGNQIFALVIIPGDDVFHGEDGMAGVGFRRARQGAVGVKIERGVFLDELDPIKMPA